MPIHQWRRPRGRRGRVAASRLLCVPAAIVLLFAGVPGAATAAVWSLQPAPAPQVANGELSSVRCMSTTSCMAVGSYTDGSGFKVTLAERWNGTSWAMQSPPYPSGAGY
jgi:hypothetical protein